MCFNTPEETNSEQDKSLLLLFGAIISKASNTVK